uniref:Helitron helicase-like domain-containing protein n=1 Tax=Lactuca sativa TaxID=4236 RepID=A0A9R1UGK4_LACSA|nr:hypothetical protein LSAT_V11C900477310 [Lactuca sativa]
MFSYYITNNRRQRLISTNNYTGVTLDKENINPVKSFVYQHTIIDHPSTNSNGNYIFNNKFRTPLSTNKDNSLFGTATISTNISNINVRTPFSNISNGSYIFNNNFQTPLSINKNNLVFGNATTSINRSAIIQNSSSIKLPRGKHHLKRKTSFISAIPMFDLTLDEEKIDDHIIEDIFRDYFDHGDQIIICQICHAKLWKDESVRGQKKDNTSYSLCCGYGKVELPPLKEAPSSYQNLYRSVDSKSKHFMKNIRRYNSMFSFTSMGGKVDSSINRGNAPYIFKLSGQDYHSIGSLLPTPGSRPKFCQLYIYDTENEISNRSTTFGGPTSDSTLTSTSYDLQIIEFLKVMLDSNNALVKSYRMVRDTLHENPCANLKLRLIGKREQDGRTYNLPTSSEVAALVVGDFCDSIEKRDIVVQTSSGFLQRISELHPSYLALQYPLLFPYGDDSYRVDILHRVINRSHLPVVHAYENLRNQQALGSIDISNVGQRVILPSSFTVVYTIEFQKRGLPHSHICLFMHAKCKLPTVEDIDPIISAEIPNIDDDPELYSLVKEFMIHGPCGAENLNCPCMVDGKCSKNFPKQFCDHTSVDSNGFPLYRRRNDGHFVEKSGVQLDNRNVVPYNKYPLKRYQAHINVEWCNQGSSIKYLFKYINKGPDRATVSMVPSNNYSDNNDAVDEIKEYYDCRYISACEASWRIFKYDVHYRYPAVIRLPFHLPNQQQVVYEADDDIEDVLDRTSVASSMFTSWMKCNEISKKARKLTYVEFPTKFVWHRKDLIWKPRKVGYAVGRIHSVSPKLGEAYFLRILLNKVKGPKSFEEIRTVNGELCSSFKDVCYTLGLLDDDKEFVDAIKEASLSRSGFYLLFLFATMLLSYSLCKPEIV